MGRLEFDDLVEAVHVIAKKYNLNLICPGSPYSVFKKSILEEEVTLHKETKIHYFFFLTSRFFIFLFFSLKKKMKVLMRNLVRQQVLP